MQHFWAIPATSRWGQEYSKKHYSKSLAENHYDIFVDACFIAEIQQVTTGIEAKLQWMYTKALSSVAPSKAAMAALLKDILEEDLFCTSIQKWISFAYYLKELWFAP